VLLWLGVPGAQLAQQPQWGHWCWRGWRFDWGSSQVYRSWSLRAHVALPEYSKEGASKSSGVPELGGKMHPVTIPPYPRVRAFGPRSFVRAPHSWRCTPVRGNSAFLHPVWDSRIYRTLVLVLCFSYFTNYSIVLKKSENQF